MSNFNYEHAKANHRATMERNSRMQNMLTALQVYEARRTAKASEALAEVQSQIQVQKEHENLLKSLELNVITEAEYAKKAMSLGVITRAKYLEILLDQNEITKVEYAKKALSFGVITPNKYIDILIEDGSLDEIEILSEKHAVELITWREMVEGFYELEPEETASWLNDEHKDCVSRIESCDDYAELKEILWRHKEFLECSASLNLITNDQCEHFLKVNEQKRKVLHEKLITGRLTTVFLFLIWILLSVLVISVS